MKIFPLLLALPLWTMAAERPAEPIGQLAVGQQVLVERMARLYAWHWLEPANTDAPRAIDIAAHDFDRQLANLNEAVRADADLADNYALLKQQWQDYRGQIAQAARSDSARQVLETSEDMAWIAGKGAQMLAERGSGPARPIELADHVAALSQRLGKIFLLQSAGLKVPFLTKDLAAARTEFDQAKRELAALPGNTPSIQAQIELMAMQWLFFQQALDALAAEQGAPQRVRNVVTTSERIYEVAIELAARYQRQIVARR
jgi:hypothetical protein